MADPNNLRSILIELSMGRLTVDEAHAKINDLARPGSSAKSQKSSLVAGLIVLLVGLVFGGVGVGFGIKAMSFSHDAGSTEGTVVRYDRSGGKGNTRVPIVRYTVDGKDFETRGIGSNMPPALHSKVKILYKSADPNDAQIDSFVQRWLFPLVFGGVGGLVSLVGLSLTVYGVAQKFRAAALPTGSASERFTV
jgi:hypothetical protein